MKQFLTAVALVLTFFAVIALEAEYPAEHAVEPAFLTANK